MDWTNLTALLNQIIYVLIWACIAGSLAAGLTLLHERRAQAHRS